MKKVVVTINTGDEFKSAIEAPQGIELSFMKPKDCTVESLADVNAVIGNLSPTLLNELKSLEWVHLESAGADAHSAALPPNIMLTNSRGAYAQAISEYILGGIFYFYRRFGTYQALHHSRIWRPSGDVDTLHGKTICILGYGSIGQAFAKLLQSWDCTVIGVKRTDAPAPYADEIVTMDKIADVLPRADIVVSVLPHTKETDKLLDDRLFSLCKKGSVFINAGRGTTVDSDALVRAQSERRFKNVLLDVCHVEPLPEDHALWTAPDVLITPHVSGNYSLKESLLYVLQMANENLKLYSEGKELNNQVDRTQGY